MIEIIRKHSKIIIGIFVFVSLAFIAEEGIIYFLRYKDKNKESIDGDVLIIDGERVKYSEFKRQLDNKMSYWGRRFGIKKNDSFWSRYLKNNLITEYINNISFKKIAKNIGLKVGIDEIIDLVQGDHINPEIKNSFTDKDGVFRKEDLLMFLKKMSTTKEKRLAWEESEQQLRNERNKEKLTSLLKNMRVFNDLICQEEWKKEKAKFDVEYLYVPYSIIKDEECIIDEKMERDYLNTHQMDFQQEENYKLKYFILNYKLSEDDIKNNLNRLSELKEKFAICDNAEEFAKVKSDKEAKKHKDEYLLKCSYEELPEIIKKNNDIKEKDVFIEITETLDKSNKLYKIIKFANNQYEVAVIFKKPFISEYTKKNILQKIQKSFKNVLKLEDFLELAKEKNVKVKTKKAKTDEVNIEGLDDTREIMHIIINTYKQPQLNFVFKLDPIATSTGIFCCIVEKHDKKGTRDFEDIKEDLRLKCLQECKFKKILEKIQKATSLEVSFDEIKNKNIDIIKFGKDVDLAYDSKRLKGYGRTKLGMNNIFLLKEGENTNFFADENGALMIKLLKIKNDKIEKFEKDYLNFYNKKNKEDNNTKDLDKIFEQRFLMENNINKWF